MTTHHTKSPNHSAKTNSRNHIAHKRTTTQKLGRSRNTLVDQNDNRVQMRVQEVPKTACHFKSNLFTLRHVIFFDLCPLPFDGSSLTFVHRSILIVLEAYPWPSGESNHHQDSICDVYIKTCYGSQLWDFSCDGWSSLWILLQLHHRTMRLPYYKNVN